MIISFSRMRAWQRCHRLYHYKYERGLTTKRPKLQLVRGSLIHEALDAIAKNQDPNEVFDSYREKYGRYVDADPEYYGELFDDCVDIINGYLEHYQGDGNEWHTSEHKVRLKLSSNVHFTGIIDKVLRDENGSLWLLDHKTHKVFPDEAARFTDLQLVLYSYAWNELNPDEPVVGIVWDYLRTKAPAVPQLLKNGTLSKRKNIDTTADVYLQAIWDNDLDPNDYRDMLEMLDAKGNRFYKRHWLPHPPEEMVKRIVNEVHTVALDLGKDRVRTMSKDCSFCDFYDLCNAELRGHDAEYLLDSEYRVRDDADYLEEETEDEETA